MATDLRRLEQETFGEKLARARATSGVGMRAAADLISDHGMPVSFATVSRLENHPTAPTDLRRRMLATLVVLAYGFDPEDFGLSLGDLPRSLDLEAFLGKATELRRRIFNCLSDLAADGALAGAA